MFLGHTDTQTHRHTHTGTHTQAHTHTHTNTHTQAHTGTHRHRHRHRHKHTHAHRHSHTLTPCLQHWKQPSKDGKWLLVWGGSSAVGSFVVQLAKASGFKVVATASPRNFDKVRAFGADAVVDYHSEQALDDIKKATGNALHYGYDAVGKVDDVISVLTPGQPGFVVSCVNSPSNPVDETSVKFTHVMLGTVYAPERKQALQALANLTPLFEDLLANGTLKPLDVQVLGGLEKTTEGLALLASNKVSAKKLVVSFQQQ